MRSWWRAAAVVAGISWAVIGPASAIDPCVDGCSRIEAGSAEGPAGGVIEIPLSFQQAPADGQAEEGPDDIAAIALTIGVPGSGDEVPVRLATCDDSNADGLVDAVTVAPAVADGFRVVAENTDCVNRNRCLCPGEGQVTDNFINLVVYGPRDLPADGPVSIPRLPSGELLRLRLRIDSSLSPGTQIPVHIFAETDDPASQSKPTFGAFFSQGDQSAIDQTVDRSAGRSKVLVSSGQITVVEGAPACVGDCDGGGTVTVNELVTGVNIALGLQPVSVCPAFDANNDDLVSVNELVQAVGNALNGCP